MTSLSPIVLLVEGDIFVRHPLAEYLRECGFTVFEAANDDEAKQALKAESGIEIVLVDIETAGGGFALRQWIKERNPPVEVILAGSVEKALQRAGDLCNDGPALAKPYGHILVRDHILQALARRDRSKR